MAAASQRRTTLGPLSLTTVNNNANIGSGMSSASISNYRASIGGLAVPSSTLNTKQLDISMNYPGRPSFGGENVQSNGISLIGNGLSGAVRRMSTSRSVQAI